MTSFTVASVLPVTACFFAAGAGLMHAGTRTRPAGERATRWLKYGVYILVVHGLLGAAQAGRLTPVLAVILAVGALELWRACRAADFRLQAGVLGVYAALGWGLLDFARAVRLAPQAFVFLYLVVAAFDAYSQLVGQWAGRTRITPRLSPHKTLEGAAGGLAGAVAMALALGAPLRLASLGSLRLAQAAAGVSLLALAGDLAFSAVKRARGLKDFGAWLPGHGGLLDRFDSLILAAPVAWWGFLAGKAWYLHSLRATLPF